MAIDIVLVHTGTIFPEYINDCITQLKKYNFNIHLILDKNLHKFVSHSNIILSEAENYYDNNYNKFSIANYDLSFRDGFWQRTSSRFFIINNYSKKHNLTNFFHIENDILIFSDLVKCHNLLKTSEKEMFLVIDAIGRCIPSILFFKDSLICDKLCTHIFENSSNNDMLNLYSFFIKNIDKVSNFPILPFEYTINQINFGNLFEKFNCIFDGAAIGQYLAGVDPRNNNGNTIGFVNETTIFKTSDYQYNWLSSKPYMFLNNNFIEIVNLHMHCKNLRKFINE